MINKNLSLAISVPKFLAILFVVMTISIPVSFNIFKTFSSDASVCLNDLVNNVDDETDDDEGSNLPFAEIEEVESEIPLITGSVNLVLETFSYYISHRPKTFISSYIFSIFIPPSL